jgi:hypothetical protein
MTDSRWDEWLQRCRDTAARRIELDRLILEAKTPADRAAALAERYLTKETDK